LATTADIRNGLVINFNGELVRIIEFQHLKYGRGGARVWTKFKKIKTGQVIENTFRSGERIEIVRLEAREMQYLYRDGDNLVFMNTENFEQIVIPADTLGDNVHFIKENETVKVMFQDETPVDVEIPVFVNLKIVETEPGIKGDTVTGATKPAVLETGFTLQVPLFLNVGDVIRVDTRTGEYCERIK